ncbi:MAG: protein-(glutamine-N5) methyltransferase, release factor-specific [Planctomycetes bacterium GWF2_41_51]|nr:MAG: protein-(glutamine-N5) methyltransferase, release factor-specific [Planctomycetes bacterium GWF2_41_51]
MTSRFTEKKIDSPRLTAELLLSFILNMQRIELYMNFDKEVEKTNLEKLRELVKRCLNNEPVQYLIGRTEFYSLSLKVSKDCLIPRPETELLVERAIEFLRTRTGPQHVCDLCTGSGCIAVSIAKNFPQAAIIATDICDKALSIAAENIAKYNLGEKIHLLHGDLFKPIIDQLDGKEFDLIVCNPPYISLPEYENLDQKVKSHEPKLALEAGPEGLDIYRRIAAEVGSHLKKDGLLLLEIGYLQGKAVKQLLDDTKIFGEIKIEKDLSANDRIVSALKIV